MFEKELELLLEKNWTEEELKMINKLLDNLTYYKKLIPKSLKQEIAVALQMCNNLKVELESFRERCTCNNVNDQVEENESKHTEELTTSIKQLETSMEKLEDSVEKLEENLDKIDN